jgi:hypothetical protein
MQIIRYGVGLDVAMEKFDVCISSIDMAQKITVKARRSFPNNSKGYQQFYKWIRANFPADFPDGFLYFKYKLDINFYDEVGISYCIQLIKTILEFFWRNDIPAVATADYEDQLPFRGGYKSIKIPWPGNISN